MSRRSLNFKICFRYPCSLPILCEHVTGIPARDGDGNAIPPPIAPAPVNPAAPPAPLAQDVSDTVILTAIGTLTSALGEMAPAPRTPGTPNAAPRVDFFRNNHPAIIVSRSWVSLPRRATVHRLQCCTGSALDGPAPREVSFVGYHITSRGRSVGTPKVGVDSPKQCQSVACYLHRCDRCTIS